MERACYIHFPDNMALEQVSPSSFGIPLLVIIPPLLHTHLSPLPEVFDSPDHAAEYHILSL
jgi:hypothetical protein